MGKGLTNVLPIVSPPECCFCSLLFTQVVLLKSQVICLPAGVERNLTTVRNEFGIFFNVDYFGLV